MENKELNTVEGIKARIYGAFSTCSRSDVNFALELFELLCEQGGNQSQFLQYICELWGTIESNKESYVPERINEAKYNELKLMYGDYVDGSLNSLIRKGIVVGWERPQFYENLWNLIENNPMLTTVEEKAFALFYIAIDVKTPYFKVGTGLRMNGEDFSNIQDEIFDSYRKFLFVVSLEHEQKTQEASLVLDILEHLETEEQKVVLMSRIISYYNQRVERIIEKINRGR